MPQRIFIHGLEGSSQGVKAVLLRGLFPDLLTPDFRGSLDERMASLRCMLSDAPDWILIGSSLGGLMAALFAIERPAQVRRLVLLAPALIWPGFAAQLEQPDFQPLNLPTLVYHGLRDDLVPIEPVRRLAERAFARLEFHEVDDDHGLYQTVQTLDWKSILES